MADEKKPAKGPKPGDGKGKAEAKGKPEAKGKSEAKGKGSKPDKGKTAAPAAPAERSFKRPEGYKPRLKDLYEKAIRGELAKRFGYKNLMQVPRLEKIVLNM